MIIGAMSAPVTSSSSLPGVITTDVTAGVCRLPQWGVLRAAGDDAVSFLHGQLSNDVSKLDLAHARLAAYCDAKGRMLASLTYAKRSATELWLLCSADLLPTTLKRLNMFVLRAKAKLSDASAELIVLGLVGDAAAAHVGAIDLHATWDKADIGAAQIIRLPDAVGQPRWLWIGPQAEAEALCAALPALDTSLWQWLDVQAGVAPVVAATAGQFVPQMLNYELVGGVDFQKGCYPGQEIVARSQYLGKLKRRAFLLAGEAAMQPGQEVIWSEDPGQPAGLIAQSATGPDGTHLALAELKIGVTESGSLHLARAEGPLLHLQALPYALPHEASSA